MDDGAEAFLRSMAPRLLCYLHVLLGDLHEAEDVLQGVFVKFIERGPKAGTKEAEGWLFLTGRNEALNARRGSKRRRRREEAVGLATASSGEDPGEKAEKRESLGKIGACLKALPDPLREVIFLKVVEGLSYSEIAARVDRPRSTVAVRAQEALILLDLCFHGAG